MQEKDIWITVKAKPSLRDEATQAARDLDSDLSKELRRAMRELIEKAKIAKERVA
jgi:hypothetical protein